jgi:hypothetical protein
VTARFWKWCSYIFSIGLASWGWLFGQTYLFEALVMTVIMGLVVLGCVFMHEREKKIEEDNS